MKFYDKVQIVVQSGKGWDGATSARREAGVPYGWPNGWNGWHGGSVILQADRNYNTLLHLKFAKEWSAKHGEHGESADKYGRSAEDLIISLPVGSLIKVVTAESSQIIYHFTKHGEQFVICKGWIGWAGNMHFKNSLVQFPDFALEGEPGQKKTIEIELQLLADVGLIGMPSVGKSSIINSISNSKAKVAEYHFTTLVPNLGSVAYGDASWNVIDIPGLVEWASEGKGLGNEFLRHVLKARLFCFVLDVTRWDEGIKEFGMLWREIIAYIVSRFNESFEFGYEIQSVSFELIIEHNQIILYIKDQNGKLLLQKWIVRIINKIDELSDKEVLHEYREQLLDHITSVFGELWSHITKEVLKEQIIEYSTILDEHKAPLLQFMRNKLSHVEEFSMSYEQHTYASIKWNHTKDIQLVGELSDEKVQDLLHELGFQPQERDEEFYKKPDEDNNNSDPDVSKTPRKLWKLFDPQVARLSYQLPWWKVLAEERFWRVMKQQGLRKWLHKVGVRTGDLLWVIADYDSNQHIVFPYALE